MISIGFRLTWDKIIAFLLAVALIVGSFCLVGAKTGIDGSSDKCRREYISSLGYTPSSEICESANIQIPNVFSDVYEQYNLIQRQAGFDLRKFSGRGVVRYTYALEDYDPEQFVVANLLVWDDKIIGGDISSRRLDGFMLPLVKKQDGTA